MPYRSHAIWIVPHLRSPFRHKYCPVRQKSATLIVASVKCKVHLYLLCPSKCPFWSKPATLIVARVKYKVHLSLLWPSNCPFWSKGAILIVACVKYKVHSEYLRWPIYMSRTLTIRLVAFFWRSASWLMGLLMMRNHPAPFLVLQ